VAGACAGRAVEKADALYERALRGGTPIAGAKEVTWSSPRYFSLTAVFLLASIYTGYSQFYSADSKERAIPTMSVVQSALKVAPAPLPEIKAPLSLSMNIIGQRKEADGSYTEVIVREGSVLQSRDHFQVHVETNRPSHVYILLFDSEGSASQLFPDPKIEQPGFVEGGRKNAIPDRDLWFWLDEHPGEVKLTRAQLDAFMEKRTW
jgi:hypothetical protein